MPYSLPSWIKSPGDLGSAFTAAYHAGASVAIEQARLDAQAQEQAQQFAVQEKRLNQQALLDQQQLQVSKAFHEASVGIKQQELQQTQQRIALAAQTAAEKLAGQAKYQKLRAGGMSASDALLATPELFPSGAGLASIANAQQRQEDLKNREATVTELPDHPGYFAIRQPSGYLTMFQRPERSLTTADQVRIKNAIGRLKKEKSELVANPERATEIDNEIKEWVDFGKGKTNAAPGSEPILMKNKQGQTVRVPLERVDWAKQNGYTPQ